MRERLGAIVAGACLLAVSPASAATLFIDDFNRPNSSAVGNGWSEIEDDADSATPSPESTPPSSRPGGWGSALPATTTSC